ncbi:LLM class flavin-dependent oxidoreductase [Spiractinospora alimapuensis]|uniref:LLM class flavin-dependent oxidoreductase n=1 Tax=Spiractinospora alimapuensis TaxID=2820884 RepID=UPI001F3F2AEB|nr:LLM class flavin-dependent oxidoreductase [Spiractinospora alimapuensis]QVQ50468.1 LLM class flavin-dependent oxidoreductase [Spiractinospora alimapuensis]
MRYALFLPPFGELADPTVLADLAADAEAAGFQGFFLWDHIARPHRPELAVGDPWISLAAVATRTERMTLGTRITPLTRRRPQVVARQAVALDRLSGGRFVLGVGPGTDSGGELTRFGEVAALRERAARLDEALDVVCQLWSGEEVEHDGTHFRVDGLRFLPTPVQRPRIPIWVAAQSTNPGPMRRAARFDGLCPETTPEGLAEMLAGIGERRGGLDGFDVAAAGPPGQDPEPYRAVGATWWLVQLPEITTVDEVTAEIERFAAVSR